VLSVLTSLLAYGVLSAGGGVSDVGSRLSCISSLPLGAKIGLSVILALAAWLCGYVGFSCVLDRRINAVQGVGYAALSLGLFLASVLPFWLSSSN